MDLSKYPPEAQDEIKINYARGEMNDHVSAKIYVRDFPPYMADEKSHGGGQDRGPSPLEFILMGLCA